MAFKHDDETSITRAEPHRLNVSSPASDRSFRPIRARHVHNPIVVWARHVYATRIAADLAILDEAAGDISLDIDLQLLAAERTRHQKIVVRHGCTRSYACTMTPYRQCRAGLSSVSDGHRRIPAPICNCPSRSPGHASCEPSRWRRWPFALVVLAAVPTSLDETIMITRRELLQYGVGAGALLMLPGTVRSASASAGRKLTKYVEPLPLPGAGIVVAAPDRANHYSFTQTPIQRQLHPDLPPTPLWAYDDGSGLAGQAGSFGMAVVAQSGTPLEIDFTHALPETYPSWLPVDTRETPLGRQVRLMTHLHGGFVGAAWARRAASRRAPHPWSSTPPRSPAIRPPCRRLSRSAIPTVDRRGGG